MTFRALPDPVSPDRLLLLLTVIERRVATGVWRAVAGLRRVQYGSADKGVAAVARASTITRAWGAPIASAMPLFVPLWPI